jgi:pilus assembly protein CpaC
MGRLRPRGALWVWLPLAIAAALFATEASAQQRELPVPVSSAQIVNFPAPARSVFIADPAIADIQVASPDSVIVFGRKPG